MPFQVRPVMRYCVALKVRSTNAEYEQSISVIGLGVAEDALLSEQAKSALNNAELVIGSERQLLTLTKLLTTQKTALLPKLNALKILIESASSVVVLGSGDPLYYGIGSWLTKQFNR